MTPDRAAAIFRELLITPSSELVNFSRRQGLMGHPGPVELEHAKDLLQAMMVAMSSGPGPNWSRIHDAHQAMVSLHGKLDMNAMGVAPPAWIRADALPAKPSLGDAAPGTSGYAQHQEQRERFVPAGKPRYVPPAEQAHGYPPPPEPQAQGYPPAPQAQGYPPAPAPQQAAPPPPRRSAPAQASAQPPAPAGESVETSVAKYAAFCAACAALPARMGHTMIEYGVASDAERERIDDDWQDRFDENPALHQQWERMFHQFRDQLRKNQR
jgi:hypothetical protein